MESSLSLSLTTGVIQASPGWLGEMLRQAAFADDGFNITSLLNPTRPTTALAGLELADATAHIDVDDLGGQTLHTGQFQILPGQPVAEGWQVSAPMTVTYLWWWDGDGTLEFIVADQGRQVRHLRNTDCKKRGRWSDIPTQP